MKLCVVTSVFEARKSRNIDYYLSPTIDLLNDFKNSNVNVCVFTDQKINLFPQGKNIHIIRTTSDEVVKPYNFNKIDYIANIKRKYEYHHCPDLISIWLGKIPMMKEASKMGDVVLWQDSGILMSLGLYKHSKIYVKGEFSPINYEEFISKLDTNFIFMRKNYVDNFHDVCMSKYNVFNKHYVIMGGFILAKSNVIDVLQHNMINKWNLLIKNKDYGTEENALTLFQWENNSPTIDKKDWLKELKIKCN